MLDSNDIRYSTFNLNVGLSLIFNTTFNSNDGFILIFDIGHSKFECWIVFGIL